MEPINQASSTNKKEGLLHYGPLIRNTATAELSDITIAILNGAKPKCTYDSFFGLEMEINDKKYNISLLLECADFTQLVLDRDVAAKYSEFLEKSAQTEECLFKPELTIDNFRKAQNKNSGLIDVEYGEAQAINIYTGNNYGEINSFLRRSKSFSKEMQNPELLNSYVSRVLLVSMLAISGLNRIEKQEPITMDLASFRVDNGCMPAVLIEQRMKAIEEYKKANYTGSISELTGFISSAKMSYEYKLLQHETDEIDNNAIATIIIGYHVGKDCITFKVGSDSVKIDSPDPLFYMITSTRTKGKEGFNVNEKNMILNHNKIASLLCKKCKNIENSIQYQTEFTNLIGKNVAEISQYSNENEVLMPPTSIQWVDCEDRNGKVYFIGHPIYALEAQKDVTIVEGYNIYRELQEDRDKLNVLQEKLIEKLVDAYDTATCLVSEIWRKSAIELLDQYIKQIGSTNAMVQDIKDIKDLKSKVGQLLKDATAIREISAIVNDDKKLFLHEFRSALEILDTKTQNNVMAKTLLAEIQALMQKTSINTGDLVDLAEKIKPGIPWFEIETDQVLSIALEKLHKLAPEISPLISSQAFKQCNGSKPLGSNPGGTYIGLNGKRYYLKFPAKKSINSNAADQITKNEVLAAQLYELAGVKVPRVILIEHEGHLGIASEIEETFKKASDDDDKLRTEVDWVNLVGVKEGFVADCWLANWDVVGLTYDNIGTWSNPVTKQLEAFRVDTGGALLYRAQGEPKGNFLNTTNELDSMRGKDPGVHNEQAEHFFATISNDDQALIAGVKKNSCYTTRNHLRISYGEWPW